MSATNAAALQAPAGAEANADANPSHGEDADGELHPIAVLLDELKNEDMQLRMRATRGLKTIAAALGHERTRTELLPFITDTMDDDDEVLLALADELGRFVGEIGGPAHASCLMDPLASLSTVEETTVRDKAVQSLRLVSETVLEESPRDAEMLHVHHLFPLVRRLATGDWFTSRISACALFATVYARLPQYRADLRSEVITMYKTLARDETPMVRRAAASNVGHIARAVSEIEPNLVATELLPVFADLVDDEQDSVRLLVVENAAVFASLLTSALNQTTGMDASPPLTAIPGGSATATAAEDVPGPSSGHGACSGSTSGTDATVDESTGSGAMSDGESGPVQDDSADIGVEMATSQATSEVRGAAGGERPEDESLTSDATMDTPSAGLPSQKGGDESAPSAEGASSGTRVEDESAKEKDLATTATERIISMVRSFVSDRSWRVRYMVADQLSDLCAALGPQATRDDLLPAFCELLRDFEPEVRTSAACKVADMTNRVVSLPVVDNSPDADTGVKLAVRDILPIIRDLVSDTSQHVRAALASNIMGLAPILGRDLTIRHLVEVVLNLLRDDFSEVRLNVISRLDKVTFVMSVDTLSRELLPAIVELAEDKNWRVRLEIIGHVPLLARELGADFFKDNKKLGDLCISWLRDTVYSIREAAIVNLKSLTEVFGVEWAKENVVPQVLSLFDDSTNYLFRMTALYAVGVLSQVMGPDMVETAFLGMLIDRGSQDPVPNVRFCSAKTLNRVIPYVRPDAREAKIRPCLLSLADGAEKDNDVKYFAREALNTLASCPS